MIVDTYTCREFGRYEKSEVTSCRGKMSYQKVTGCLSQGAHPGSYNGQDAYNDMLVIDENHNNKPQRYADQGGNEWDSRFACGIGLQRPADSASAERERERESMADSIVRRLTPRECERLQGMPDDWSLYGINEKGEVYELPDSARYRLQGNGIATPFWKVLLKRISAQYERDPTMGSLFAGQGSFEYLWTSINGIGTVPWSSEIDKHGVAVITKHFGDEERGIEGDIRQFL